MYKVILIDDEKIILEGLQKIVDWENFNCYICATANTAEDGIEKIIEHSPDIIFTDIKMKSMSGLEMLEEVSEYTASSKIVIMTAHRNFEYAHKSIELGVSSFLLKPTTLDDINKVLNKVTSELDRLSIIKHNMQTADKSSDLYTPLLIEKFLSDVLASTAPNCDSISSDNYNFQLKYFIIATISIGDFSDEIKQSIMQNIKGLLSNIFPKLFDTYLFCPVVSNEMTILISAKTQFVISDIYSSLLSLQKSLCTVTQNEISIGCSSIGNSIKELKIKYQESRRALEHRRYIGDGTLIFFADLASDTVIEQYYNKIQQDLFDYILSGDIVGLDNFIPNLRTALQSGNDINHLRLFCYDTLKKLYASYQITHADIIFHEKISSLHNMIFSCDNSSELIDLIEHFSYDMANKINTYTNYGIKYKLKNAITYIEENYEKSITRNDISQVINVTPNYVSSLFKKGTNMTLIEYITKLRIEKAKELLSLNKYKHYEIANMVGFNDNYYFSKTFKKYTGLSPLEYQKKK